jgi:hypothetical protein
VDTVEKADQPPTNNCQHDEVTNPPSDSSPYCFPRNTCAVSVTDESTTARPGQDTKRGWDVRPSRPLVPPSVPRRGVPSIAQCVESRDCETPMRIDPQGPQLLRREREDTRSIPTQGQLPLLCTAAAPWLHWSGDQASSMPHPIPPPCRTAKFALFMRQPARWRGWYGTRRPSPSGQFVARRLQQRAHSRRGRGGRPSTLDRVAVIGSWPILRHALLRAAPEAGRYSRSISPPGPTTPVVLHPRAGLRRPCREGARQVKGAELFTLPSLAIIAIPRVIDGEIRAPVDITSAYCLNTVPGNCLDCVAESQTGSGERRGKHEPNCNAFHFLGLSRGSRRKSPHSTLFGPVTQASVRLAAVAPLSCRPVGEILSLSVSVSCREFANVSPKPRAKDLPVEPGPPDESESTSSRPPLRQFTRRRLPLINAPRCSRTGPGKQSKTPSRL